MTNGDNDNGDITSHHLPFTMDDGSSNSPTDPTTTMTLSVESYDDDDDDDEQQFFEPFPEYEDDFDEYYDVNDNDDEGDENQQKQQLSSSTTESPDSSNDSSSSSSSSSSSDDEPISSSPPPSNSSSPLSSYITNVLLPNNNPNNPTNQSLNTLSIKEQLLRLSKTTLITSLRQSDGDTTNPRFLSSLDALTSVHNQLQSSKNNLQFSLFDGRWHTISKPHFRDCLGRTPSGGDFMYTLGRLSFDMFRPTDLKCGIQKVVGVTRTMDGGEEVVPREVPWSLKREVEGLGERGLEGLRTYDIEIHFSIEPDPSTLLKRSSKEYSITSNNYNFKENYKSSSTTTTTSPSFRTPSKAIKAIMTNYGYLLPDPDTPHRCTVWFTGGVVAPVLTDDNNNNTNCPSSSFSARHNICCLSLHECRRRKTPCPIHGTTASPTNNTTSHHRYFRPPYGPGSTSNPTKPSSLPLVSQEWDDIFAPEDNWKRGWGETVSMMGAQVVMGLEVPKGMDEDGTMSYTLRRPLGGHGVTFVDVLYLDENLRVLRGNTGRVYVQRREVEERPPPPPPPPSLPVVNEAQPALTNMIRIATKMLERRNNDNEKEQEEEEEDCHYSSNQAMAQPDCSKTRPKLMARQSSKSSRSSKYTLVKRLVTNWQRIRYYFEDMNKKN